MGEIELVVFDLAGTTVRDGGQVVDSFTAALEEYGLAVTPEQLGGVRGAAKREAVLRLVPDGPDRARRAGLIFESFRARLARRYRDEGVEPVEGADEVFRWLRGRGVRVALNTGFDRDITGLLLSALGWSEGAVDAVVCGDDVRQGRPAPYLIFRAMEATGVLNVRRVANVGDTVLDLQAGRNAGARWNVGVLSGAHGRPLLGQSPHTHLLESVAQLPGLWRAGRHY